MLLTVLDLRYHNKSGPIEPDYPKRYVAVHHVGLHGTFPVKDKLTPESVAALARFANKLERAKK